MGKKVVSSGPTFFFGIHSMPAEIDIFKSKAASRLDSVTHHFLVLWHNEDKAETWRELSMFDSGLLAADALA